MGSTRRAVLCALGGLAGLGGLGTVTDGGSTDEQTPARPTVLVAGSLLRLADQIPGAVVEPHGSAAVRRLIRNGMRDPDAVAVADPRLLAGISDRATLFATNALVLAYAPDSAYASNIRRDWREAIQNDAIRLGRTDPETDPLGYRTVMALRLARARSGLDARDILNRAWIRRESDLLNVLDGGRLDAAFAYRNMAVQRDLPYVSLPDRLDFSNPAYADVYRRVSYNLGETTVRGAPIRYAATPLTDAGASWVATLTTATDRLLSAGFLVPPGYPRRDERLASGHGGS